MGTSAKAKLYAGKGLRVLLAIVLILTTLISSLCGPLRQEAHASEGTYLSVGGKIPYGGFATTWMWADGQVAYCGNPSAATPGAGYYTKHALSAPSGRTQETAADLWFGYGSPGFDPSMWPSTWYDGSAMTDSRYAALTHILLSDTYTSNGHYATYGCNASFKSWCQMYVIGYGNSGECINENATGLQICARQWEIPRNFEAFQLYTGASTQLILSFDYIPYGEIELTKASSNPSMTDNNPCYSLEGAQYTVYEDAACTSVAGTITTDGDGYGKLEELMPGTYYVKETKTATGYALDYTVYPTVVRSNETTPVNGSKVYDIPQSDPMGMLVSKIDVTTGKSSPQGAGTLAGAQFTVEYFKGIHDTAEAARQSGKAERTWVFQTDEDGFAYFAQAYKASGDPFYYQSDGVTPTSPLGTLLVTETKAPEGYNLDDGYGNEPKTFVIKIQTDWTGNESIYVYNSPTQSDTVKRGDFRLVKEVPVSIYSEDGGDSPQETVRVLVPGVQFQLISSSDHAIVSPETGDEVEPGEVVCTITTDTNGLATTHESNAQVNGWMKPADWTASLAYATYTVHEVIPQEVADAFKEEHGKDLLAIEDWKVTVNEEGQYDAPVLVNDHIPQTPLRVEKVDAETGNVVPLPCSFQLLDSEGKVITYTSRYPETQVTDTWTTNEKGEFTLPMLLEQGTYTLVEVQAPEGYVLEKEGIEFTVDAEYRTWENPIVVKFADMPQKAQITVSKTDSQTAEPVMGSTYIVKALADVITPDGTIRAKADDIVALLVTGEDGHATTPELYLGRYGVYEAKATDGYALDVIQHEVTLEYRGQEIALYEHVEAVTDDPSELRIKKVDALDGDMVLAGAVFKLWNDEGFEEELITGEDGTAKVSYLKHGTYYLQELQAPDGYVIDDLDDEGKPRIHEVVVNDQGLVQYEDGGMWACLEHVVPNMPRTMGTTLLDSESKTHFAIASDSITLIDTIEYRGCVPGEEYSVEGTLMDRETGEPLLDAEGNAITSNVDFTAEAVEGSVDVTFIFDASKLVGHDLVAFEVMSQGDEVYMTHEDIDDEGQTVSIVSEEPVVPTEGKPYPKTGAQSNAAAAVSSVLLIGFGLAGAMQAARKRMEPAELVADEQ